MASDQCILHSHPNCTICKEPDYASMRHICKVVPSRQHIMIRTYKSKYQGNKKVINKAKFLLLTSKNKKIATIALALYLLKHYKQNYKL